MYLLSSRYIESMQMCSQEEPTWRHDARIDDEEEEEGRHLAITIRPLSLSLVRSFPSLSPPTSLARALIDDRPHNFASFATRNRSVAEARYVRDHERDTVTAGLTREGGAIDT